jgi:hypothetical protein
MSNPAAKERRARRLLTRHGEAAQIARSVTMGGGPSDPTGGTTTTTRYDVQVVLAKIEADRIDGTNIQTTDVRVLCTTTDVELTLSDRIECSAGDLAIIDLGRHAPDGTTVFYDMVARR